MWSKKRKGICKACKLVHSTMMQDETMRESRPPLRQRKPPTQSKRKLERKRTSSRTTRKRTSSEAGGQCPNQRGLQTVAKGSRKMSGEGTKTQRPRRQGKLLCSLPLVLETQHRAHVNSFLRQHSTFVSVGEKCVFRHLLKNKVPELC